MKRGGVLLFLLTLAGSLSAVAGRGDVIHMKDGRIYIGKVVTASAGGVTVEAQGRTFTVDQMDILKTDENISALKELPIEVVLNDGSVIKGTVSDYDEEVGFLIDLEIGSLTVPPGSVRRIENPEQRNYYNGYLTESTKR